MYCLQAADLVACVQSPIFFETSTRRLLTWLDADSDVRDLCCSLAFMPIINTVSNRGGDNVSKIVGKNNKGSNMSEGSRQS